MGPMLMDEQFVAVFPSLVRRLGLMEAMVLQTINFHFQIKRTEFDGHYWTAWSCLDISKEIGVSEDKVFRAVTELRRTGVLVGVKAGPRSRLLMWRIDRDVLSGCQASLPFDGDDADPTIPHGHGNHSARARDDLRTGTEATPTKANASTGNTGAKNTKNIKKTNMCVSDFDALWITYPKKVGKASALEAFEKVRRSKDAPTVEVLIAAVKAYSLTVSDIKYCAHLSTWLNGQRWADETLSVAPVVTPAMSERMSLAIGIGASHGLAGYGDQEVIAALEGFTDIERNAGLNAYWTRMRAHRGAVASDIA